MGAPLCGGRRHCGTHKFAMLRSTPKGIQEATQPPCMCPITVSPEDGYLVLCADFMYPDSTQHSWQENTLFSLQCPFSSSFILLLGYHTVSKFWGNMGYISEKEFYFGSPQVCMIKGICLRLRKRTLGLLPPLFPPFSDQLTYPCLRTYEPAVA